MHIMSFSRVNFVIPSTLIWSVLSMRRTVHFRFIFISRAGFGSSPHTQTFSSRSSYVWSQYQIHIGVILVHLSHIELLKPLLFHVCFIYCHPTIVIETHQSKSTLARQETPFLWLREFLKVASNLFKKSLLHRKRSSSFSHNYTRTEFIKASDHQFKLY
jgi:hypothetical protein